jgi:hypothetical protein
MRILSVKDLEKYTAYEACEHIRKLEPLYTSRPSKPTLKINASSSEVKQYASELEEWELSLVEYTANKEIRDIEARQLYDVLEEYLKEESGFYQYVPKESQNKVWSYAWQQGHSSGYSEVYNYLLDLVGLFEN